MNKITDFRPQRKNANRHTEHGLRLLEKSLQQDGFIDAQTVAADGEMISGSARLEVAADKFANAKPIIVESDGTRPVIVKRVDIPNADDPRAKRLSVAANQIAKTDLNFDGDLLKEWAGEDEAIRKMFADYEWASVTGDYQEIDYKKAWEGMPEFEQKDLTAVKQILVSFNSMDNYKKFAKLINQNLTEKTRSVWYPERPMELKDQLGTKAGLVFTDES